MGNGYVSYDRRSPRGLETQTLEGLLGLDAATATAPSPHTDRLLRGAGIRLRRAPPESPSWHATCGPTPSWPTSSSARGRRLRTGSTGISGPTSGRRLLRARGSTREGPPDRLRCAPTSATCCGGGIVDAGRADRIADSLLAPELFSGWGVRTMSHLDLGFNPIGYHTGTVWPHDNSLVVAGLCRYGHRGGGQPDRRGDDRGRPPLRLPAARGVRGLRPAARRPSPSSTRPPARRRRGRPARRSCAWPRCSGSGPTRRPAS